MRMQKAFMQLTRVVFGPVSEALLIHCGTQMKMRLVTEQHNRCIGDILLHFQTQCSAKTKWHYMYLSKMKKNLFVTLIYLPFIKPTNVSDHFARPYICC
uniref:Uncharacterized protein n=1 Tax=Octopus bimaculoides TaxID=37653 RepID=A0A0L8I1H6_OCTBM